MSKQMSGADHLEDMDDGCGCAEVWEHMSERRAEARAEQADD
jgi:hypothetical protein